MRSKRSNVAGVSLAAVLIAATVAFLVLSGVWQVELYQVAQSRLRSGHLVAENLTDGVVSLAIARLKKDVHAEAYNKDGSIPLSVSLDTHGITDFETEAFLTFDPADSRLRRFSHPEQLVSVNNLSKDTAIEGPDGYPIEPGQALLIGIAKVGQNYYRSYTRVNYPDFPYSLATAGSFSSYGGLVVGGAAPGTDPSSLDLAKLTPGGILANGKSENAVSIVGKSRIVGDVRTSGTAQLGDEVSIEDGKLTTKASPEELPHLDLSRYDTAVRPEVQKLEDRDFRATNVGKPLVLSGLARSSGTKTITGGIELNSAVLFHDGDLKMEYGGLKGTGALFVTGKLEITGQADLATTALCAIVAKQGLVLKGSGKERSSVHGLVYSEGPVVVQDVTVIGSLVNGLSDTSASPPPMQLSNAAFVRDAAVFKLDLDLQFGSKSGGRTLGSSSGDLSISLPPATTDPKSGFGPLRYLDPKTGKLRSDVEANKLQDLIGEDLRNNAVFVRSNGQSVPFSSLSQNEKDTLDRELKKKSLAFKSSLEDWMKQAVEHPPYKLTLDLNRFIKVQSRLKVVGRQISKIQ